MESPELAMQAALSTPPFAGRDGEFVRPATEPKRGALSFEIAVLSFAMLGLVAAELMLSSQIQGTNFGGVDGKMAQAVILAAQKFGGFFHFNNINPIEGLGSQLLPINVWMNPTYWPFAVFDKAQATDTAAAVALGIFAIACYVMARCFDLPIVPSAIAAQLTIVLFAPLLQVVQLSTVFAIMVGNAVVYAPYMVALGLLARLDPGTWRRFGLITAGMLALLFYSLCCDPLWSVIAGWSWAIPFAIVALSPMRPKTVLIRCAALACCAIILVVSGAAEYVLTLTLYTARVQFPTMADRLRLPDLAASGIFHSPYVKYFYLICAFGWSLGLLTLHGRARVFVIVGMASCSALLAKVLIYLLLQENASWSLPLPAYVEQSLFPLFLTSAMTGYWGALRVAAVALPHSSITGAPAPLWSAKANGASAFAFVALMPAAMIGYAVARPGHLINLYNERWPDEPELAQLLGDNTAQAVGKPFRGAVLFYFDDPAIRLTIANLWVRSVPTIFEYSQLVTPQSVYFDAVVMNNDVRNTLNSFWPVVGPSSTDVFARVLPMIGTRYFVVGSHWSPLAKDLISLANQSGHSLASKAGQSMISLPQGAHNNAGADARWHVYEIPHPNLGDYSPTIAITAETAAAAVATMVHPGFDFTKQVVLSTAIDKSFVSAHNMQMSLIRGGLHVSGHSDGISLIVLPQQFSHCLRALDKRVRLLRANMMMTGVIFSGQIDTDIVFDYGLFTPRCRWADISDIKKLEMRIDARAVPLSGEGEGLFPNWEGSVAKLRAAVSAIK
jgi:hypothetical protein